MEKKLQPSTPHLVRTLVALHVVCIAAAARCSWEKRAEQKDGWVCEKGEAPLTMYAPHVQTFAPGCVSPLQTNTKVECKIKQTNKLTNKQFHRQSQGWIGRTTGDTRETSIPDARPRTANHLARRNHPSAQHSTHAAKRHSYNPTAQFLTRWDLVFHPFMDLSSSTVSQSVFWVCLWTWLLSLQPSIGGIWVYFWDLYFSEFGCVGFETICGVLGVILDLYFLTCYFGFILGLCRFSL
jgi:hypothetical protein